MKILSFFSVSLTIVIAMSLNGCVGLAYTALAYAPSMIDGAIEYQRGKYKDVKITLSRGYTIDDLKKINSVSFLVSEGKNNYFAAGAGEVFGDNISREFLAEGYDVIDRSSIEDVINEQKFQQSSFSSNKKLAQIGTILGINGIFKGSISAGQNLNRGFMGIGAEMTNGIKSASLKLIDVKTAKTIMIISTSYKKAKDPSEVAKDMAKAYKLYQQDINKKE